MKMKFKIGFLASLPLTTDTELVTTTVKFQPRGERLERVGGGRERDQYRACLQTVADETGQEDDPRDQHCLLPHPANTRVSAGLQCYKSHVAADGDGSASRGRSSSTSSSEFSNTNNSDSISFNSTNSSGSNGSTGNSFVSSSTHNSESINVQTNNRPGKKFTFSPRNDSRKRRIGTGTNSPASVALTTTTTTACLEFNVNGKADIGDSATKGVKLKTNSLSSNSSYESQTSSNSSNKSFRNFFHRGSVFSNSIKLRNSIKKSGKNNNDKSTRKSTTATTTTINSGSSVTNSINSNIKENSRFLLPADSVTNIVVVGDKGVGKSAISVRFLTRRYIGEYSSDSEMIYQHDTTVDHAPACLQLLDVTTMQTPYQILNHLSWAHAFVVVLHHSYNKLLPGHAAFGYQDCLPSRASCSSTVPLRRHTTLLLGNKRDLEHIRRVWTDEGEALSLEFSCQFYEVSAAESVLGVHLAFHSLLKETRALQLIRSLPYRNSQDSTKGTVSSAVSKVIGNFFRHVSPESIRYSSNPYVAHRRKILESLPMNKTN
ncbi:hypothetical protein O3P69_017131 [Scylla paramamosain]|uniref:small monomeric GTPase n=1 Tax=Scylla paramamosain TaxID=85552 RepID=A0AAW0TU41_SCYPA